MRPSKKKPALPILATKGKPGKTVTTQLPQQLAYGGGSGPGVFSNFESAKFSNKRSYIFSSWPQDFKKTMTVFDRMETTRKMRWLELNAGLIRQVLSDMALYTVGSGIKAQAQSGDEMWDDAAECYFKQWGSRACDITGRFSFFELQHICCRLMDRDGECFIIKTRGPGGEPRLQVIESHRVGNSSNNEIPPGMVDGILFGPYGQPISYNVIRSDGSSRQVPANAVLHLYEPELASGARAYSPLQHSINNLVDMLEILSMEKLAVKTSADITRTISRENPNFDGSQSDFEAFGMRPQDYQDGLTDPSEASTFLGGKVLALAPGEKLDSFESNRPNKTFDGFIEHLERDSLAGMLPYEFSANPTKAGGAVMRFVVAKADRKFSHRQQVMMQRFLTPVWGYIIGCAIKEGYLRPTEYWTNVTWTTPRKVTVDAGRDAQQNRQDIESGLKTLTQNYLEEGEDPKEKMRENAAEKRYLMDLSEEFKVPLSMLYKPQNISPVDINMAAESESGNQSFLDDGERVTVDPDDDKTSKE